MELMNEDSPRGKLSNIGNVLHNIGASMEGQDQLDFEKYAHTCWDISKTLSNSTDIEEK
jgi:hypothetical protein